MGCGSSKIEDKPIDIPLNNKMEKLEISLLDENYEQVSNYIISIERIRQIIIDKLDENYLACGVCELKRPTLKNYIKAVMTLISINFDVINYIIQGQNRNSFSYT